MSKLSFGTDPEFMLVNPDGKYISAIGVVPGTKEKQHKIGKNNYYYDNVLAECTVVPSKTRDDAVENIGKALRQFAKLVAPNRLVAQASCFYPEDQLKHKDAIAIGCSREYCAYMLRDVEPPEEEFQSNTLRTGGGHIHVGHKFAQDFIGCVTTIRLMDLFLGLPSIFLDKDPTSPERKKLYGKSGRFRKPEHGAEYRTMGNFWLSSPTYVQWVFDTTAFVTDFCEAGKWKSLWEIDVAKLNDDNSWNTPGFDPVLCHKCVGYDLTSLRKAIDEMDRKEGEKFLPLLKELMPGPIYKTMMKLAERTKPFDLTKEWSL